MKSKARKARDTEFREAAAGINRFNADNAAAKGLRHDPIDAGRIIREHDRIDQQTKGLAIVAALSLAVALTWSAAKAIRARYFPAKPSRP